MTALVPVKVAVCCRSILRFDHEFGCDELMEVADPDADARRRCHFHLPVEGAGHVRAAASKIPFNEARLPLRLLRRVDSR